MVNSSAIIPCSNNSSKEGDKNYFVFRTVITQCGEQTTELSQERRDMWVTALSKDDLCMDKLSRYRICSNHFITGWHTRI